MLSAGVVCLPQPPQRLCRAGAEGGVGQHAIGDQFKHGLRALVGCAWHSPLDALGHLWLCGQLDEQHTKAVDVCS